MQGQTLARGSHGSDGGWMSTAAMVDKEELSQPDDASVQCREVRDGSGKEDPRAQVPGPVTVPGTSEASSLFAFGIMIEGLLHHGMPW